MANPYFLMALLYLFVAVLAALDASLVSFQLLPWFNGLRWLRVHFITLGILTEVAFGVMPILAATRLQLPIPKIRWDIWLTLNIGLVLLVAGIPIINQTLILAGGTLIFLATMLLMVQLWQMRAQGAQPAGEGRKFYATGLAYLLLGILVGTGLWLGWSGPLRIQIPIEVHIHANNWGFLSLVFAGLLIDVIPQVTGRPLASTRSLRTIFWMMTLGALGLVIGPWLGGSLWAVVPGLLLHLSATIWVVAAAARALFAARLASQPGTWHLITAYVWILAPVMVAPLIILGRPGFPGAGIEATAPQALIYGWVLQFSYALIPYFVRRFFLHETQPPMGGSWLSLFTVHAGSALVWASIFIVPYRDLLHGAGYAFYVISLLPITLQLSQLIRSGVQRLAQPPLHEQKS
jgi:cytochrome c oxidase cbb3-type subunit I